MGRFTLPRDLYYGKDSLENLKNIDGKKAIVVSGGSSMRRGGFLDKVEAYLKEAGMEVQLFEGVEPDPSVETVMKGAKAMTDFQPDVIVAIGGGSPIDAAKAMWAFYEYPEVTFEQLCTPFSFPKLRQKAKFVAIPSTSGTATEVTAFSVITDYAKGIIDITNEMGPYYVLTDDVALIHGRPETGVLKKQLAAANCQRTSSGVRRSISPHRPMMRLLPSASPPGTPPRSAMLKSWTTCVRCWSRRKNASRQRLRQWRPRLRTVEK